MALFGDDFEQLGIIRNNKEEIRERMIDARKIIDQKAIKKTNTNIRKPRNFIISNFALQINNNY